MSSLDYYINNIDVPDGYFYFNNGSMYNCTAESLCLNETYNYTWIAEVQYEYEDITFWQVPQLVLLVILFVFIVFGNTCVLVAIGLSETGRKTRMNFFILNLAIADLTVGLFHVPVDIVERCLIAWYGGAALCKVVRFLEVMVMYASSFMLVSLSIDRVDAIARPMNFTRKAVTVRALVFAAWITAALFAAPCLMLFEIIDHEQFMQCNIRFTEQWHWQLYFTLVALTTFVIPALIIAICYTIILIVIWDKGRGFSNTFPGRSFRTLPPYTRNRETGNTGIIPQAKIRTVKMTLMIVVMFVLCWSPYFVFNFLGVYQICQPQLALTSFFQSLAPLNSAANPIIYGIFSTRICRNLRRIPCIASICDAFCRCRLHRNQSPKSGNQSTTEQTLLEGGTNKNNRRSGGQPHNEQEVTNLLHHNGNKCSETKGPFRTLQSGGKSTNGKGLYKRRPSGLPLVNRSISEHDTLILQTYRNKMNVKLKEIKMTTGRTLTKDLSSEQIDQTKEEKETANGYLSNTVIV